MGKCPECGGLMESLEKKMVCKSCGLALARGDYDGQWDKLRGRRYERNDESNKEKKHREYRNWIESSKK